MQSGMSHSDRVFPSTKKQHHPPAQINTQHTANNMTESVQQPTQQTTRQNQFNTQHSQQHDRISSTPDTQQMTRQNQFNTQHSKQHDRISSTPNTANNTIESVQGYYLLSVLRRLDSDLLQLLLLCDLSCLCVESSFQVILQ